MWSLIRPWCIPSLTSNFERSTSQGKLVDTDPDEERTAKATLKDGIQLEMIDTVSSINSKVPSVEYGTSAEKFQGLALQFMNIDSCSGFILCFSLAKRESFLVLEKYYDFILACVERTDAPNSQAWLPRLALQVSKEFMFTFPQRQIHDLVADCTRGYPFRSCFASRPGIARHYSGRNQGLLRKMPLCTVY